MTKTEIKEQIHSLIDKVEDNNKLENLHDVLKFMVVENDIKWSDISDAERKSIEEGLEDIKNGRITDYEDIKKKDFCY